MKFYCDVLGFELTGRCGLGLHSSARAAITITCLNTWESLGGSPPPPGSTGLYHTAIRYPTRAALADAFGRLERAGIPLQGAADHGVSESLYLTDPDQNGVELYCDRPRSEWPRGPGGEIVMYTRPLDLEGLLAAAVDAM